MSFNYLHLLLIGISSYCCNAECPRNLKTVNNQLLTFSTSSSTYNAAVGRCRLQGAEFVSISNQNERNSTLSTANSLYLQSLSTVSIFQRYCQGCTPGPFYLYKYRVKNVPGDPTDFSLYNPPGKGELSSIKLYTRSAGNFTTELKFYWFQLRDRLLKEIQKGWNLNFQLYGANQSTSDTITVHSFRDTNLFSSRFSLSPTLPPPWVVYRKISKIYLPDISIFIGATSDVNQSTWHWNNGTTVNDPEFPPANSSICQQMTWPLTYDDGINLRAQECGSGKAHFICKKTFAARLQETHCSETTLNLTWNSLAPSFGKSGITVATVRVTSQNFQQTFNVPISQSNVILTNLTQRTNYNTQIVYTLDECNSLQLKTTASGRTGYGVPDQVTNAYIVESKLNPCTVMWRHNTSLQEIDHYRILLRNSTLIATSVVVDGNRTTDQMTHDVDLSLFGPNITLFFSIQAVSSCNKKSLVINVDGNCTTPQLIVTAPAPSFDPTIAAAVAAAVVILIITIALILFILRRKKKTNLKNSMLVNRTMSSNHQEPSATELASNSEVANNLTNVKTIERSEDEYESIGMNNKSPLLEDSAIQASDLQRIYLEECSSNCVNFQRQYEKIKRISESDERPHDVASKNKKLNRYKNVYPYDHALVPISRHQYINASFIEGFQSNKRFIATQGPKPNTIESFWDMIWTHNVGIIVMLCNSIENQKIKCSDYWPSSANTCMIFNIFDVWCESENLLRDLARRQLIVTNLETKEKRTVIQFQYIGWPDHGIPASTTSMTKLRKRVNAQYASIEDGGPIVVHCSAGAGRTGTYIAIDNLIEELEKTKKMDAERAVMKMRRNRKDMVQNLSQYLLVYKLVVESSILPETEIDVDELVVKLGNKKWFTTQSSTEYWFLSHPVVANTLSISERPENSQQLYSNVNESQKRSPYQVSVRSLGQVYPMDAHVIQNHSFPGLVIASGPLELDKEELFLNMLMQQNTVYFVALEANDHFVASLTQQGEQLRFGNVNVTSDCVDDHPIKTVHQVSLYSEENQKQKDFTLVILKTKEERSYPEIGSLMDTWKDMRKVLEECDDRSSAVIYSSDTSNRTGLFLAAANLVEQSVSERKVDVLRTVKDLQVCRSTLINTLDSYRDCYHIIEEFLNHSHSSESIYENV